MTKSEDLLVKLRDIGSREARRYENKENVIGIALAGSLGRGDIWEGSDVDIYIVKEGDNLEVQGEGWRRDSVFVNIHYVSKTLLENLNTIDVFTKSQVPSELYGCVILYDPTEVLASTKALIEESIFSEDIVKRRIGLLQDRIRECLEFSQQALNEDDLPTAMFYCWIVPIPHLLFVHFRKLIRSTTRFPELFIELCIDKSIDGQLREYYGPEPKPEDLLTTYNYFEEAWKEVIRIFRQLKSSQLFKKLSPKVNEWVENFANTKPQDVENITPLKNIAYKSYEAHIEHGYIRGAMGHMRSNATQDLVNIMNRLYEGIHGRLPKYKEPFSPFKILRDNKLVNDSLYQKILLATGINNIRHQEARLQLQKRKTSFQRISSIIQ